MKRTTLATDLVEVECGNASGRKRGYPRVPRKDAQRTAGHPGVYKLLRDDSGTLIAFIAGRSFLGTGTYSIGGNRIIVVDGSSNSNRNDSRVSTMSGRLRTYDGAVNGVDVSRGFVVARTGVAQAVAETESAQLKNLPPTSDPLSQSVVDGVLERATDDGWGLLFGH